MAPIQFTVADYLFKTRVEGREFSLHFIELKIIGYQASVNICESRRFVLQKFLCHGTRCGNKSTFFLRDYEQFWSFEAFDISLSCALVDFSWSFIVRKKRTVQPKKRFREGSRSVQINSVSFFSTLWSKLDEKGNFWRYIKSNNRGTSVKTWVTLLQIQPARKLQLLLESRLLPQFLLSRSSLQSHLLKTWIHKVRYQTISQVFCWRFKMSTFVIVFLWHVLNSYAFRFCYCIINAVFRTKDCLFPNYQRFRQFYLSLSLYASIVGKIAAI